MNQFIRFIRASFARTTPSPARSSATARSSALQLTIATFATLIALLLPQPANSAGYTVDTNSMNMTEMWWNPDESGWGASVIHRGNIMFIAVYTYNTSGLPKWYVVSRCEVSGSGCVGDLYDVTGGVPLTSVWNGAGIAGRVVGTFTMTFTDANHGIMEGKIDGVSWTKTISRELFGSVPCTSPQVANDIGNACVDPAPASACLPPTMENSKGACMLPPAPTGYTWNNVIKAWVADIGTLVSGLNALPVTCVTIGDTCWEENVADGTIKFANSGVVMTGQNTRPIVLAIYTTQSNNKTYYVSKPIYADVVGKTPSAGTGVLNGGVEETMFSVKGSSSGLKQTATSGCWELVWDTGGAFVNRRISCPI